MACNHDVEHGHVVHREDVSVPLIVKQESVDHEEAGKNGGSLFMVLLSTIIAVCGSFQFGCIVRWISLCL